MLEKIVTFALLSFIAFCLWQVTRPRYRVKITIDKTGAVHCTGIAAAHQAEILEYFQNCLHPCGGLTIRALRESNGCLRISISGRLDPGTRQQIRNFLNTVL